jgi:large subunit ribosomal protein L5
MTNKKTNYKVEEKISKAFEMMKSEFNYTNTLQAPRLTKISVSVATGRMIKADRKRNEFIIDRLTKIVGQKATERQAKKSIATFKTRTGDKIGVAVTLRGPRMYAFLEKLLNVSLPRTKDFRGIERKSVDAIGNMTFGIKEHTIFPEIKDEELKDVFGMAITLVTTAKTKNEATRFLEIIGLPFKK